MTDGAAMNKLLLPKEKRNYHFVITYLADEVRFTTKPLVLLEKALAAVVFTMNTAPLRNAKNNSSQCVLEVATGG